jgi:hypothetical protein
MDADPGRKFIMETAKSGFYLAISEDIDKKTAVKFFWFLFNNKKFAVLGYSSFHLIYYAKQILRQPCTFKVGKRRQRKKQQLRESENNRNFMKDRMTEGRKEKKKSSGKI